MNSDLLSRAKYFFDFFNKAQQKSDDEAFEGFIYHWLAMIIGMTDLLSYSGLNKSFQGDRELIQEFQRRCQTDFEEIQVKFQSSEVSAFKLFLAKRKGSAREHCVLDFSGDHGNYLAQLWKNQHSSDKELESFLIVACIIRNNLFHGKKSFMNPSDVELIKNVVPLINNINLTISKLLH
jgi:hypothetical protein